MAGTVTPRFVVKIQQRCAFRVNISNWYIECEKKRRRKGAPPTKQVGFSGDGQPLFFGLENWIEINEETGRNFSPPSSYLYKKENRLYIVRPPTSSFCLSWIIPIVFFFKIITITTTGVINIKKTSIYTVYTHTYTYCARARLHNFTGQQKRTWKLSVFPSSILVFSGQRRKEIHLSYETFLLCAPGTNTRILRTLLG